MARSLMNVPGSSAPSGGYSPVHVQPISASWAVNHAPAANTQATASQAAAGASTKNVCTGFMVTASAGAAAPTAIQLNFVIRDGATGAGTVLWAGVLGVPATAGASTGVAISGLWLVGTANTAMTIEFSAAGGANTIEAVSMQGTTQPA